MNERCDTHKKKRINRNFCILSVKWTIIILSFNSVRKTHDSSTESLYFISDDNHIIIFSNLHQTHPNNKKQIVIMNTLIFPQKKYIFFFRCSFSLNCSFYVSTVFNPTILICFLRVTSIYTNQFICPN